MHVKESVKDFIHDVKHKFTRKHKRDSCSTCVSDRHDGDSSDSTADTLSHLDTTRCSVWSSSTNSSQPTTPERSRLVTFSRPRTRSTSSAKYYQSIRRKVKRPDVKRHTVVSAVLDEADERGMFVRPQTDDMDILDIRTPSVEMGLVQFDKESHSDTSGTLVSRRDESTSMSDTYSDSFDVHYGRPPLLVPPMASPDAAAEEIIPPVTASPDHLAPARSPPVVLHTTTPASPVPVYIPRLTAPSMFLPIPNTDPLNPLLTKHIPAEQRPRRDVVGEYAGRDVHEMVMSNSWRALARMARDRIVASDPEDLARILDLWSLRLSSLARLRLTNQASAECTNLFAVLNAVPPTPVPGSFPGSFSPSTPHPFPTASLPLSPSGLSGLAQLPGTPSQKPSTLSPLLAGAPTLATASRQGANEPTHSFELTVFHARVQYWSGDPLGYVDALSRILGNCKERAREEGRVVVQRREMGKAVKGREGSDVTGAIQLERADEDKEDAEPAEGGTESTEGEEEEEEEPDDVLVAAEANLSMWLERIARVCLMLASQMIEMNDYQAAINLLVPLCTYHVPSTSVPTPSPALHSALARVYLLSGNLQKAKEHFTIAASAAGNSVNGTDTVVMNTALLATASGDWMRAEEALGEMIAKDPGNFTAINNLAVTLLYQGRIKEGIDLLEAALKTSPSSMVVAEPFLFNLSTLYEFRSTAAIDKKRELLLEVAKWSGDGLRTSCLKMPSS